ncbi:hypothetical protein PHPALM_28250 [Phytophthora palmivora]|uniref:Uncharacterized protein n=1 Tax=Phytophthora palmivora TaxID=4796 RepID=A0A2P4XAJ8_9STRA|nr:hypothetical protein PHPALM_28250 [Phytophthora palmivora]
MNNGAILGSRGGILKWSHCDENVHSSLVLATLNGHTQLALRRLDEIDIEKYHQQNNPLQLLQIVIKSGNVPHVLAIAKHMKIQAAIKAGKDEDPFIDTPYTIIKSTELAVQHGMTEVLCLMNTLNHPRVSKTMNVEDRHSEILGIADQYAKDWRWGKVKELFLVRYRGHDAGIENHTLRSHLLVRLPDQLFRLVVEFIQPKEISKYDAGKESSRGNLRHL